MKYLRIVILMVCLIGPVCEAFTQDQQTTVDSLVNLLKSAGREWNEYAKPLISIGEPAVPALIEVAEDRQLSQWQRRIAIMTLNDIRSEQWVNPALSILFDRTQDPELRNHVTAGLKGFDLTEVSEDLWQVYHEANSTFYKLNLAGLLPTADTALAYQAFKALYNSSDGYVRKSALLNLVRLRSNESTAWFLDGLQLDDWMTANLAMDSLVTSQYFVAEKLLSLYNQPDLMEGVRWRIVYVFGHRDESESIPLLLEAFKEESWLVHTEAAVGLCRFDPERVLPEMNAMKKDPRPYVQQNSKWVIGEMKSR